MSARTVPGSSPLTRGKHPLHGGDAIMNGLIPAHAGKTSIPGNSPVSSGAHPRSRGENPTATFSAASMTGSSPLTRGKLDCGLDGVELRGLIPAHAGKTQARAAEALPGRAHPRSRGENSEHASTYWTLPGSSPLTRGKRLPRPARTQESGLIPAHAGKTMSTVT